MPPPPKTEEERLRYRILELESENAILKKLQVLNQEKWGLKGKCKRRKYHLYQGEVGKIAENLLQRDFQASAPNEKWVTDVTEFKCTEGKRYLSPIKDLFNEEIIAYDLSRTPNFEQITRMMTQAVARFNGEKPILHSDQEVIQH